MDEIDSFMGVIDRRELMEQGGIINKYKNTDDEIQKFKLEGEALLSRESWITSMTRRLITCDVTIESKSSKQGTVIWET